MTATATPIRVNVTSGKAGLSVLHRHQEQRVLTCFAISLVGCEADMGVTVKRNSKATRVTVEHWTGAKRTSASLTVPNEDLDADPRNRAMILTTVTTNLTEAIKATLPAKSAKLSA